MELEPYVKYYEEFNLKNAALEFYEKRIQGIVDNSATTSEMMSVMSDKLKADLADEESQVSLFREDFYPVR